MKNRQLLMEKFCASSLKIVFDEESCQLEISKLRVRDPIIYTVARAICRYGYGNKIIRGSLEKRKPFPSESPCTKRAVRKRDDLGLAGVA